MEEQTPQEEIFKEIIPLEPEQIKRMDKNPQRYHFMRNSQDGIDKQQESHWKSLNKVIKW